MKIIEYKVASIDAVPGAIREGWQPWGSPLTIVTWSDPTNKKVGVYQAIVKYEVSDDHITRKRRSPLKPLLPKPNPTTIREQY